MGSAASKLVSALTFPPRLLILLLGVPTVLVYAPLRVALNRLVYPRKPLIPNAPASFEVVARTTQFLFGVMPEGTVTMIPQAVFAWLTLDVLHRGARKHWKPTKLPSGTPAVWYSEVDPAAADLVILQAHGGGYCVYSPAEFSAFIVCLQKSLKAKGINAAVLALDYTLAPQARFPVQLEEAVDAYKYLLDSGIPASKITVLGDSAGANLAINLALHLSVGAPGLPMSDLPAPSSLVLICPWVRLYSKDEVIPSEHSMNLRGNADYITNDLLRYWAARYAGSRPTTDPWISPLMQPAEVLAKAMPKRTLILAGTAETLYDDILAFKAKLPEATLLEGIDKLHDYVTLDPLFGLLSFNKEERELGVEQIASFLAAPST